MARVVAFGVVLLAALVVGGLSGCKREESDVTAAERLALQQEKVGLDPYGDVAFSYADENVSGAVDADEFRAAAMRMFARLDRNGDMVLEPDERLRRPGEVGPPRPPLDAAAFNAGLDAKFAAADLDGDKALGPEEWGQVPWREGDPVPKKQEGQP